MSGKKNGSHKKIKIKHKLFDSDWSQIFEQNIHDSSRSLEDLMVSVFMEWSHDRLVEKTVRKVVREVKSRYNENSYHNFTHACHVTLNCANSLYNIKGSIMSPIEQLSLIYAALIHDVDHLGVPNATLIRKSHELAVQYNDQSVAEMHSLSIGLNILAESDLLKEYSKEDQTLFRHHVVELVLCTDIAEPYKKRMTFVKIEDLSLASPDGYLDVSGPQGRVSLLSLILRTCDVGSSSQSFRTLKIWAHRFFLELKNAATVGDGPPATIDFFFADQPCYMTSHVLYLIDKLRRTGAMNEEFVTLLHNNCVANIAQWREHGMVLLGDWDDATHEPVFD